MIYSLTSMRFFASMIIVISHIGYYLNLHPENHLIHTLFFQTHGRAPLFTLLGTPLMTLFFILTGFVITYRYEYQIKNQSTTNHHFLIARFARLYPTYLLTLGLSLPLLFINNIYTDDYFDTLNVILKTLLNLCLLHSYVPYYDIMSNVNPPIWTLSVDVLFYLSFPYLIKMRPGRLYLFTLLLLLIVFSCATVEFYQKIAISRIFSFITSPFFRIVDFIIGIHLARLFIALKDRAPGSGLFHLLEPLSIGVYLLFFCLERKFIIPVVYAFDLFYLLPIGFIVLTFAFQKGFISRFLQLRSLVLLGNASYAIYIYHWMIISYTNYWLKIFNIPTHATLLVVSLMLFVIGASIGVALLSYTYFEQPLNNFIRRRYTDHRPTLSQQKAVFST